MRPYPRTGLTASFHPGKPLRHRGDAGGKTGRRPPTKEAIGLFREGLAVTCAGSDAVHGESTDLLDQPLLLRRKVL